MSYGKDKTWRAPKTGYIFIQDKELVQNQPASRDVMAAELEKLKKRRYADEELAE